MSEAKPQRQWDELKRLFILQGKYRDARKWLREEQQFSDKELESGYVIRQIAGWGKERASKRQALAEEAYAELREVEKERMADLLKGKLNLMKLILDRVENEGALDDADPREIKVLWEIIKTELAEPTSITKTGIYADRSSLEEAEKELRDITNANDTRAGNPSHTEEISKAL